jgi:SAM-dependent methyltransferase
VAAASWRDALLDEACRPYLKAGPGLFAYFFARGKLRRDPVFRAIIERGLLSGRTQILDLGCGQALLAAWLRAAARLHDRGVWPHGMPAPPRPRSIRGVELMARDVSRARRALGPDADITLADIRECEFGTADAIVLLDVLHYLAAPAQRDVLRRVHAALPPGGVLLLRVGDAGCGLRPRYTQWVDRLVLRWRGHASAAIHCRSVAEWRTLLRATGFDSDAVPMSEGTPFANVLLIAHARLPESPLR